MFLRARPRAKALGRARAQRCACAHRTEDADGLARRVLRGVVRRSVKTRASVPSLFRCWTFVARLCHGRYATAGPHSDGETLMRVLRSGLVLGAFILAFLPPAAPASAEPLHDSLVSS